MEQNYKKVPDIITGKDLDYLADMFKWFYDAYKCVENDLTIVNDNEIKKQMKKCSNNFYDYMNTVLDLLEKGGQNE
ncbi:MAG: hypothetical protein IJ574_01360 [Bacilli bacterium]|nr:hypothetical protein [Bacilli bacterium]